MVLQRRDILVAQQRRHPHVRGRDRRDAAFFQHALRPQVIAKSIKRLYESRRCLGVHRSCATKNPCLMAFRPTRAFPSAVRGPVERAALRRLASIRRAVRASERRRTLEGGTGTTLTGLAAITHPSLKMAVKTRGHNPLAFTYDSQLSRARRWVLREDGGARRHPHRRVTVLARSHRKHRGGSAFTSRAIPSARFGCRTDRRHKHDRNLRAARCSRRRDDPRA